MARQLRRVYPVRPERADDWLGGEIARAARDPGALGVFRQVGCTVCVLAQACKNSSLLNCSLWFPLSNFLSGGEARWVGVLRRREHGLPARPPAGHVAWQPVPLWRALSPHCSCALLGWAVLIIAFTLQ